MIWTTCEEFPAHGETVLICSGFRDYFFAAVGTYEDGSRGWEDCRLDSDDRHKYVWSEVTPPNDSDFKDRRN